MIGKHSRDGSGPNLLPLLPLRDLVVFPHMIVPLFVGRGKSVEALETALLKDRMIALAAQQQAQVDDPQPKDLYTCGTRAQILQVLKMPDSTLKVVLEGVSRIQIEAFRAQEKYLEISYSELPADFEITTTLKAMMRSAAELFEHYSRLNKKIPPEVAGSVAEIEDPHRLVDLAASQINVKVELKQKLLELEKPEKRLEELTRILTGEIEIQELERRIKGRVRKQMENMQKEYYLHEQIKAIRKELGQKDDETEKEELVQKINHAQMPPEAEEKAMKELARLDRMQSMSPEASVIRTYIDWLVSLPWAARTKEKLDLRLVARTLDEDHYGLRKVKDRILEYLSVRKLAPEMKGPILCLAGPPGVGKTSLARSVARAINRNFVRIALGGVRDEAEIRGHRRTYIGAMPGRLLQSLKTAKSKNPVLLLDEIDKIASDYRGDPASALLEVLDPEQNQGFNDHYLDLTFDLSEVMFIATANVLYNIHPTLRDRMETIEIPGYTLEEKLQIAERYLVVRLLKEHGLSSRDLVIPRKIVERVIMEYTSEAGVRNLQRELAALMRKVARLKVERRLGTRTKVLNDADLVKFLGAPKYRKRKSELNHAVGVATGLAWTETGGEILSIEVTTMPGKGQLTLTGKLGEVMKESAQAAVSYARAVAGQFGIRDDFYQTQDLHIHVPEGAIPKDGPSAGIAMASAIISALSGIPMRKQVAMTGEITLRGHVLAIGGLKEKLLAAMRSGIKTVLLPRENEKDLGDLPPGVKQQLKIILAENMEEVLRVALLKKNPAGKNSPSKNRTGKPPLQMENSPAASPLPM